VGRLSPGPRARWPVAELALWPRGPGWAGCCLAPVAGGRWPVAELALWPGWAEVAPGLSVCPGWRLLAAPLRVVFAPGCGVGV
jgi:hypothetical protein